MSSEKTAVVILNWNGKKFLESFLPGVLKNSPEATVYVADNQSADGSVDFLKNHFPEVKIIVNPGNEGFAKGYNTALKQINAQYYVLLNSDVEVTENWLTPLINLMDSQQDIAACQPKIMDYHNRKKFEYAGASGGFIDKYGYPFCRGRLFNELEEDQGQYNDHKEVFWATGACMMVRAEAFWKAGAFDDDYFAHMEEIDVCWRMKNLGYKIYVEPSSTVYHVGGGTLNKLSPRKTFLNFRNNLITLTKNATSHFLLFKILYRMLLDGVAAFKFLLEGHGSHFFAVIKAHFSYYVHLPSTLTKRSRMKRMEGFRDTRSCIYEKNIVYLHFIKSVKKYSDLL
ncbi:MAG: glycosyltransferase family 2 protein [Bacteroidota bacterium]